MCDFGFSISLSLACLGSGQILILILLSDILYCWVVIRPCWKFGRREAWQRIGHEEYLKKKLFQDVTHPNLSLYAPNATVSGYDCLLLFGKHKTGVQLKNLMHGPFIAFLWQERSVSKVSQRQGKQFNTASGISFLFNARRGKKPSAIARHQKISLANVMNKAVDSQKTGNKPMILKKEFSGLLGHEFQAVAIIGFKNLAVATAFSKGKGEDLLNTGLEYPI